MKTIYLSLSFLLSCLMLPVFMLIGTGSCDFLDGSWSETCNDPFDRVEVSVQEGSVERQATGYILHFPYHVVGSYNGHSEGLYGLPEAVDEEYQEPGTSFPLNTLWLPEDVASTPKTIELGAGSGVSLEGFLWLDHLHLEFNWDFPEEWKGTFKEELCSHSCNSNHEGDMNCGIHWSLRYAFNEDQLQGSIQVRSLGSSPGDIIDIEILAVASEVDVNESNLDCCTGLHITMKGTVVDDGRIVFDEYCGDPKSHCDGCICDWRFDEGNMPLIFDCAAQFASPEEQLEACWNRADGIDP